MKLFPPHLIDFYKTGHLRQYPDGTQFVYSNFTARDDKYARWLPDFDHKVVFFGLQGTTQDLLVDLWDREFFQLTNSEVIRKFKSRMDGSLGPGAVSSDHIAALHSLGYLPLRIKALPEGSRVNIRVPLFTVINTHPDFYWLTNYLESQISAETWKSITAATIAYEFWRLLSHYAEKTGSPKEFVQWQGHDFSFRGMSGIHDGVKTGAGHLLSFTGTDTVGALDYIDDYYAGADTFVGGSVPATEHSVMCMGGKDGEQDTFERIITNLYPTGVVSIVSDTWDFWSVITTLAMNLKAKILSRIPDANGLAKVVFRPDSGDPVKIICGDPSAPFGSPAFKGAVECLWEVFGGTVTSTGHRLLDPHVGLIYGDSITIDRAKLILEGLDQHKFCSGNVVFGIGSYTYQGITRDTFGHAYKATYGIVDHEGREISKDPITDSGEKKSLCGLVRVEKVGEDFVVYDRQKWAQEKQGLLETVFEDGNIKRYETFAGIRNRLGCIKD